MEGGKWGLVIIFAAFMIQVLAFGATATIGVYNIELLEYFPGQTIGVSLIASINYGVFLGSGPIVSFMMTRFEYRNIAFFGSALVVIGILGMPILPYIPAMCFCFGVLAGFGSCCVYIPSHVLSGLYYDKYRSLATGVATSGSGLGGAIMPVVAGFLIEYYSWKGSLVIISALCLHMFIFSALLRMPPPNLNKVEYTHDDEMLMTENGSVVIGDSVDMISLSEDETGRCETANGAKLMISETGVYTAAPAVERNVKPSVSELGHDSKLPLLYGGRNGKSEKDIQHHKSQNVRPGSPVDPAFEEASDAVSKLSGRTRASTSETEHVKRNVTKRTLSHHHMHFNISTSLQSLAAVGTTRGSPFIVLDTSMDELPHSQCLSQTVCSDSDTTHTKETTLKVHPSGKHPISDINSDLLVNEKKKKDPKSSRHIYIFTHYGFNVYFFSNIMWNAGCSIVNSFAPEYLRSQGLTSMEAAWLLGAFGFGCFLGGIIGGLLGNVSWIHRQTLYTVSNVVLGLILAVFSMVDKVQLYLACLLVAGLFFGMVLGLLIVVLTDLIGVDSLSNGLGYLMLSNGIGTFIGPPLAGILKEVTGGFAASIQLSGLLCFMGGVIMLLMPCENCVRKACCCCVSKRKK